MSKTSPWDIVIKSPVLQVHPYKDLPAIDLKRRQRERTKRVIMYVVLLSLIPIGRTVAYCLGSYKPSVMAISLYLFMEAFLFSVFTSVSPRWWQVPGGNYENYTVIKESLEEAGKVLFERMPSWIYSTPLEAINDRVKSVLCTQAQKVQTYEKDLKTLERALGYVDARTPICVDALQGAEKAVDEEREIFSSMHMTLRTAGLGEEKWDSYFQQADEL